ncbi:mycofactocin-coupled SDR family oxidoreductase [Pseudonocardia kujensis]|uniref:mycofactocin-coupled SDR family oxidoreductase n=1 Tax=Pseudonocardia kujensis TaxID=1128675 RepID=UPI001E425460|nr:mycofactocin-coupled SDR family oxidoreductase [Pseudonocardia kujensis]MCE0764917.1 mycofactocin-coupled SDR family oxidoreductase [Pseudonocardia kujensis]
MTGQLEGKVALVTGAGRGQGRAEAIALAQDGASVVCLDVGDTRIDSIDYELSSEADLHDTVALAQKTGGAAVAVVGDVRSQADLDGAVATALAEFGGLDIVVANAGIWGLANLWEITEEQWADTQDVVLAGVWRTVKAAVPHLIAQRSGSIVVTSSVNGVEGGTRFAHYTAAKHGVLGLMRSAAQELAPHNVRVNAVLPGFMDTRMNMWQGAYDMMAGRPGGTPEDRVASAYHWSALAGRGALPADAVSDAVRWLVSDGAKHVTGVALPVDGGHLVLPGFNTDPQHESD